MLRQWMCYFTALMFATQTASQNCYFPNGKQDDSRKPCWSPEPGEASPCCLEGQFCLTSGLCLEPNAWTTYRGSCTDISKPGCPTICSKEYTGGISAVNFCSEPDFWTCDKRDMCNVTFSINKEGGMGTLRMNRALESALGVSTASGISVGAAAGIGAGIGVPLLIAVGSLAFLLSRERRKRKATDAIAASMPQRKDEYRHHDQATEMPLESTIRHELPQ